MTEHRATMTERREHIARIRATLDHCVSSRQRQAVRAAIRHALAEDAAARP